MSPRKHQLSKLLEIAKQHESQAAKELAGYQNIYQSNKQQLDELLMYQQSYRVKFQEKTNTSVSITQLQQHLGFMHSLEQAIKQQHKATHEAKQAVKVVRERWAEKNSKKQALEHLINKLKQQEKIIENQMEQRLQDDLSIRKYSNPDRSS